jgi:hypothetical protein
VSRLADDRGAILAALEATGIRTATGGMLTAPCVLVEPGDPWSEPRRLPARVSRWRLTAIAGAVDTLAGQDELAELVDRVDVALRSIAGVQLPTWARPAPIEIADGVKRAAVLGTIQYASQ